LLINVYACRTKRRPYVSRSKKKLTKDSSRKLAAEKNRGKELEESLENSSQSFKVV